MLVTGVAGVPGYNAFHYFRAIYGDRVIGIRHRDNWPLTAPGIVACNAEDEDAVAKLWRRHGFASVVNCTGSCRLKSCELDPDLAYRVNVRGTETIMRHAAATDARVIHLSSDLVFGGREGGGYREIDVPDPVTVYGRTMVEAEACVSALRPDAAILRISLPMGISFNGHAGAIDWIQSRFRKSRPATLYFDEVRTPTYTSCLNRLFARLLRAPVSGTFHAGGPQRLSLYQIAQIVNRVGGYEPALLKGCMRAEAGPMPPRAGDVSLNSDKLHRDLGEPAFYVWPQTELGRPTHRHWHRQRRPGEAASFHAVYRQLYQNAADPAPVPPTRDEMRTTPAPQKPGLMKASP